MESKSNALDINLWEEAKKKKSEIDPEQISWFFADAPLSVTLVVRKGVEALRVCPRAFIELAIFDIMATFWESLPLGQKNKQIVPVIHYHQLLRRVATDELLNLLRGKAHIHGTPSILHPWLKRTLCLLGHDDGARKHFNAFNYPPCLLDGGVFLIQKKLDIGCALNLFTAFQNITKKPQFQAVLNRCAHHIVGKSSFHWCDAQRSWELRTLTGGKPAALNGFDESHAKGIFILPKEVNVETWKAIRSAGGSTDGSRVVGKIPVDYSVYERLIGGRRLNDEGINAYVALMGKKKGTFVAGTFDFQKMLEEKNARVLKAQVRSELPFPLFYLLEGSYPTRRTPVAYQKLSHLGKRSSCPSIGVATIGLPSKSHQGRRR